MKRVSKAILFTGVMACWAASEGYAQIGGKSGLSFLQVPVTAKLSALGGENITAQNGDVNMFLANPALLSGGLNRHVALNYIDYLADISYSSLAYVHNGEKIGTWGFGLQYMDYGTFEGFDEGGNKASDFNARDYAITIGHARTIGAFTFGSNLKFARSFLGSYEASALLLDIGGVFKHPEKEFTVGLLIQHIGVMLHDYTESSNTELPFDVQIGTTFKPEHMPIRFSLTAYNLAKGDITYEDAAMDNNQGKPGFVDKIFRHFVIGAEILLSENLNIRAGYNHLVRKELKLDEASGGAGFSVGMMFRVKAFEFAYSRRFYHVAGGANSFTLASDLGTFIKKSN